MKQELQKIKKCWNDNQEKIKKLPAAERDYWKGIYNDVLKEDGKYCQQEEALINGKLDYTQITLANQNLQLIRQNCLDMIKNLSLFLDCDSQQPKQTRILDSGARPGAVSIRPPKATFSLGNKRK